MTVGMRESANTDSKGKSNANLAFILQFFSVSDTHLKEGCVPFLCLCEGLRPGAGSWGVRF